MRKFLVTGCYGFLGAHICRALSDGGHAVFGADRLKGAHSKKSGRVQLLADARNFSFIHADISDAGQVKRLLTRTRPDVVIHLAAQYAVAPLTEELLERYLASNFCGMPRMAWHANRVGVEHFIYASSTFVQPSGKPSLHTYGASKQSNEDFAAVASSFNPPWRGMACTGMRYGSTFGAWCRPDVGIYQLARKLLDGAEITPAADGWKFRCSFLDVRDAVDATLAAVNCGMTGANALTVVADDYRRDLGELLHMLEANTGRRARCDWSRYTPSTAGSSIPTAPLAELETITGFRPRIRIPQAVFDFAEWAVAQHKLGLL